MWHHSATKNPNGRQLLTSRKQQNYILLQNIQSKNIVMNFDIAHWSLKTAQNKLVIVTARCYLHSYTELEIVANSAQGTGQSKVKPSR